MRRKKRCILWALLLASACTLTGCLPSPHVSKNPQPQMCWDLIGEWKYQDEENQFYINILFANESMQSVMMNFSFTALQAMPNEHHVESRNMSTFSLSQQRDTAVWQVDGMPEGIEVIICRQGEAQITVNSKQLIRNKIVTVQ